MLENTKAFSGFSVDDVPEAKRFYSETLGLRVSEEYGMLWLHIAGERDILVYPKPDTPRHRLLSSTSRWTTSTRPSMSWPSAE